MMGRAAEAHLLHFQPEVVLLPRADAPDGDQSTAPRKMLTHTLEHLIFALAGYNALCQEMQSGFN